MCVFSLWQLFDSSFLLAEKAAQNGSLKANEESTKKAESAGISFFLLAFIFVAITSVAVTYLSEDIKDIFGK